MDYLSRICGFFLIAFFAAPSAYASLMVTIGNVSGTNTTLSVAIVGGGVLSEDVETSGTGGLDAYTDFSGGLNFNSPAQGLVGDSVVFFANNNIGEYVGPTYGGFTGERLTDGIILQNLTDGTSVAARWLDFDDDGLNDDDFAVMLDTTDTSFLDAGDSWSIYGLASVILQKGDASDFTLGTYSYTDPALGLVTLILQEGPASISVPVPTPLALVGLGLAAFGYQRRKSA